MSSSFNLDISLVLLLNLCINIPFIYEYHRFENSPQTLIVLEGLRVIINAVYILTMIINGESYNDIDYELHEKVDRLLEFVGCASEEEEEKGVEEDLEEEEKGVEEDLEEETDDEDCLIQNTPSTDKSTSISDNSLAIDEPTEPVIQLNRSTGPTRTVLRPSETTELSI